MLDKQIETFNWQYHPGTSVCKTGKQISSVTTLLRDLWWDRYNTQVEAFLCVDARPPFTHISRDFLRTQLLGCSITIMPPTLL